MLFHPVNSWLYPKWCNCISNPLRFTYSISCLGADTNDKGATLQQTDPSCSTPRQSRLTRTTLQNDSWLNLLICIAFSTAKVSFLCWRGWTLTLSWLICLRLFGDIKYCTCTTYLHLSSSVQVSSFKVLPLGLGIQEIIAAATHATGAKYGGPWKQLKSAFDVGILEGSSNLSAKLSAPRISWAAIHKVSPSQW